MKRGVSFLSLIGLCCFLALFLASCGGGGGASALTVGPPADPGKPAQTLDAWTDESADSKVPVTNLLMARISTTATNAGMLLTSTRVEVKGTLANVDDIKIWWNTSDNFLTAVPVGSQIKPVIGQAYDIALSGAGKDSGFIFYSVSLPFGQSGNFQMTVHNVSGATADNINLPKTTALRKIIGDGSLQWRFGARSAIYSSPAVGADGTIYFGSDDHSLYAINPDGTFKWRFETGGAVKSSPAIGSDGTIYFGSIDRQIYAVGPNGKLKWVIPTKSNFTSSPAIASDGTIYIGGTLQDKLVLCAGVVVQVGYLYAVDPSGFIKWQVRLSGAIDSSPAIATDGTIYIGSDGDILYDRVNPCDPNTIFPPSNVDLNVPVGGHLYAIDPNGTIKWDFRTLGDVDSSPSIAPDGTIYVGSDGQQYMYDFPHMNKVIPLSPTTEGFLHAIYPNGSLQWITDLYGDVDSSPSVASDGTIYVGSDKNDIFALNSDGSIKWVYPTRGDVNSSPAIGDDGTVYVGSDDGSFYAMNPDGSLKWRHDAGSAIVSSPAIIDSGIIYVGLLDGNLYAIYSESALMDSPWPKFRRDLKNQARQAID